MISTQVEPVTPSSTSPRGSQHPVAQRQLDHEPPQRSLWWVWLLVILALGAAAYFLLPRLLAKPVDPTAAARAARGGPVPVVVAPAVKGDMAVYLTGLGTITPYNNVIVRSRVDGQITKIAFTEGQIVKEGDLLIQIDPRPFQVQLTQAQGQLEKDKATLENAKRDLERYQSIKNSITQQQIDTQASVVAQAQGTVDTDKGQVDNANLQLTYSQITAPIGGRIGLRGVDVGNIVHAADVSGLAVIAQLQPIALIFTVPEDQISQVFARPDHGQELPVDAFNRDMSKSLATGTLLAVDNQVDPTTGTVRIKAEFKNTDSSLFPNQFVNARLLVDTLKGVVIVPSAAVQRGPNSTFVYVVKSDNTVEMRNVVTGHVEGDQTAIDKGVAPGDVLVTDGVDKLQQGSKVIVRKNGPDKTVPDKTGAATQPAGAGGPTTRPHRKPASGDSA